MTEKQRHKRWNNCRNVRDLGGLLTVAGGLTRWDSVLRSDSLDRLTGEGILELQRAGIKTIIDLRDSKEISAERLPLPAGICRRHLPLEDQSDVEFWSQWQEYNCTPLYYRAFLERSPERVAAVFGAIADGAEGGIVFHCASGRDRTGLIAILLLELCQVSRDEIAFDYALSVANLGALGRARESNAIADLLERHKTTFREQIGLTLDSINVEEYLLKANLTTDQIDRLRRRLID